MTFGDCEEMCHIFDDCNFGDRDFGDRDGCHTAKVKNLSIILSNAFSLDIENNLLFQN